ncbi:MAG: GrpB family protein [candidate division KSB1 bacterium]|nr:GrpB family protein [candidate division KSB1 bacterium]
MHQSLHNMNSKELGRLFPVEIAEPNPNWRLLYEQECARVRARFGEPIHCIDHIGSTSVPGLRAKPVIDILLQITRDCDVKRVTDMMQDLGYDIIRKLENPPPHLLCVKGYTPAGYQGQPFHVQVRYPGEWDELRFRDILIAHPPIANDYARLKEKLAAQYKHDRDAYTDAKSEFIKAILEQPWK